MYPANQSLLQAVNTWPRKSKVKLYLTAIGILIVLGGIGWATIALPALCFAEIYLIVMDAWTDRNIFMVILISIWCRDNEN